MSASTKNITVRIIALSLGAEASVALMREMI